MPFVDTTFTERSDTILSALSHFVAYHPMSRLTMFLFGGFALYRAAALAASATDRYSSEVRSMIPSSSSLNSLKRRASSEPFASFAAPESRRRPHFSSTAGE